MAGVVIRVQYYRRDGSPSHTIPIEVMQTNYFCPRCGEHGVWVEECGGDYYVGPDWYCPSCSLAFTMPSEEYYGTTGRVNASAPSDHERQVVEAIITSLSHPQPRTNSNDR